MDFEDDNRAAELHYNRRVVLGRKPIAGELPLADGTTPLISLTKANAPTVKSVRYAYSDRRNGWYAYAADTEGNQIGAAQYEFRKSSIVIIAKQAADALGVEALRA